MTNIKAKKVILKNRDGEHLVPITDVDALNYKNITNCLLEVPQRIKYDLTDGVLTIKKGSQVIVPYGTTNENFTRVGSPTISEAGVASDINANNYITFTKNISFTNNIEFYFNGSTDTLIGSSVGENPLLTLLNDNNVEIALFEIRPYNQDTPSFFMLLRDEDGTAISNSYIGGDLIWEKNVLYYFRLKFDGEKYTIARKTMNTNYEVFYTINSTKQLGTVTKGYIGRRYANTAYTKGQIDLPSISITVDGKVVYRPYLQKGDRFLNDNFKVADTQLEDGKFFVWAELVGDSTTQTNTTTDTNLRNFCLVLTQENGYNLLATAGSGSGYTGTKNNVLYYNTSNNIVERYNATTIVDSEVRSFPLMQIQANGSVYLGAITQVFNGIGYIGSTVWVDKGVKGLIPNGRNEDGSLKNVEFTTPSIVVNTLTAHTSNNNPFVVSELGLGWADCLYVQEEKPNDNYSYWYRPSENVLYYTSATAGDYKPIENLICGFLGRTNGVVTEWQPKQSFHAADIQDVVRKTGDTMSGVLELYGTSSHLGLFGGSIFTHNMNISMDTAPSSNIYFPVVEHQDKNNIRKSRVESFFKADGSHGIQLSEKHGSSYCAVTAGFDADGKAYTYAPHCNITNGIVTQAGISKAGNGYVKFGNGVIIQWGQAGVTSNYATVTFPTAFSSTARVTVTPYNTSVGAQNNPIVTSLSKTSFKAYCEQTIHWIAVGY